MPLQIRRGTEAERQVLASPLVSGELLWITDDQKLYIGDGNSLAKDLAPVTGYGDQNARDAAASLFTNLSHSGISFVYNGTNQVTATVSYPFLLQNLNLNGFDIVGTGNVTLRGTVDADFKGSVFADNSTLLVNGENGSINLDGTVKGDIIPDQSEQYDLGSNTNRFKDLWLSGSSLHVGNATITSTGSAIELPVGSTVGGIPIGSGTGPGNSLNIDIVGDDSTIIVNTSNNTLTGNLIGNVLGNITGNLTGDIRGSVYADDSSIMVDSIDNLIDANTIRSGPLTVQGGTISVDTVTDLNIETTTLAVTYITDPDTFEQPSLRFQASRGSTTSPTSIVDLDLLGAIQAFGYNGTDYIPGSIILFNTNDPGINPASTDIKTDIILGSSGEIVNQSGNYVLIDPLGKVTAPAVIADLTGSVFSDASTMLVNGTDGSLMYYPGNTLDWASPPPTTVGEALDRLAALVFTLNSGTGA